MFRGISNLNLDAKGRVAIPTKYRDEIASDFNGQMILTVDYGVQCLVMYPMSKWVETEQNILSLPNLSDAVREIKRLVIGHASDVEMDGQGRIMVPPPLREYAGMEKKLVMIGLGDRFELWDESIWKVSRDNMRESVPINIQSDDSLKGLSI
ncbi:MAG: cell division/cell wall cluster transcriptional repressor MraZ [Thiotrichales bacterium]|nr:MAG: cell division/cell wall cluster transcriptional repressor MraZ [Thiotrichales bacterium]